MKPFLLLAVMALFALGFVPPKTETVRIKTSAICEMCQERIEKNLLLVKGVKDAHLNLDDKVVTVVFQPGKVSVEKIRQAIQKTGHDADGQPADRKPYNRLPDCCQKDATEHIH